MYSNGYQKCALEETLNVNPRVEKRRRSNSKFPPRLLLQNHQPDQMESLRPTRTHEVGQAPVDLTLGRGGRGLGPVMGLRSVVVESTHQGSRERIDRRLA